MMGLAGSDVAVFHGGGDVGAQMTANLLRRFFFVLDGRRDGCCGLDPGLRRPRWPTPCPGDTQHKAMERCLDVGMHPPGVVILYVDGGHSVAAASRVVTLLEGAHAQCGL